MDLPNSVTVFESSPADSLIDYGAGVSSKSLPLGFVTDGLLDREEALRVSASLGFNRELQPGSPSTDLRLVTVDLGPANPDFPELVSVRTVDRPSWVLVWAGSAIVVRGGVGDEKVRERLAESAECVFVVVVDAVTGEAVDSHQICREHQ